MKILITGGTGFVGKNLIKHLHNTYQVYSLIRPTSDTKFLENLNCKQIVYNDMSDILEIFTKEKFDGVVHIASNVLVEHKSQDIEDLITSNITLGTYLLEASKITNVKWLINTGTFWQNYNNQSNNPVNLYAVTKEAFEKIATYYTNTSDLILTTIKLNDTFGENDTRDKIFNLWMDIAKNNKVVNMSLGEQIMDISYIEDVVEAYEILIHHLTHQDPNQFRNKSYVVTNQERITLKELASIFEEVSNLKLNINWGAKPYRAREVMVPYSSGETVPGWKQQYSLRESIKKTIKAMR